MLLCGRAELLALSDEDAIKKLYNYIRRVIEQGTISKYKLWYY